MSQPTKFEDGSDPSALPHRRSFWINGLPFCVKYLCMLDILTSFEGFRSTWALIFLIEFLLCGRELTGLELRELDWLASFGGTGERAKRQLQHGPHAEGVRNAWGREPPTLAGKIPAISERLGFGPRETSSAADAVRDLYAMELRTPHAAGAIGG